MSYEKSATKQRFRDFIFKTFVDKPPKKRGRSYNIVTLPGTPGFTEPRSLEKLLRKRYPKATIIGLEYSNNSSNRPWAGNRVFRLDHQNPGLFTDLYYQDIGIYFRANCRGALPYDLVFEDRCGGATDTVRNHDWPALFRRECLSDGAYVAITLCEAPRIRWRVRNTEDCIDHIVKLCGKQKLGVELINFTRYDNGSLNAYTPGHSQPMAFFMMRMTYA